MKTTSQTVSYPDLEGSEQHIPLKKRKTSKDLSDDAKSENTLDGEAAKVVAESEAETQIADELRDLTQKD